MKFLTKSPEETIELGAKLGRKLKGGELIFLAGDLGAGKTQFTKGIACGLDIAEVVTSPTFTIERIYNGKLELHHFDFYRLATGDTEMRAELEELIEDKNVVCVIEWPQNIFENFPKNYIEVKFEYLGEDSREIEFKLAGEKYKFLKGFDDTDY